MHCVSYCLPHLDNKGGSLADDCYSSASTTGLMMMIMVPVVVLYLERPALILNLNADIKI